jgi:hypothetical protein
MDFRWVQRRTRAGQMQMWSLVHKESRKIVLNMWFSKYAEPKENNKVRRKIQLAYELYFQTVWFKNLLFF